MTEYVIIAQGTSLEGIRALESPDIAGYFGEGDEAVLDMDFRWDITADIAAAIAQWLTAHNFSPQPWRVETSGSTLTIRTTVGLWPLWALVVVALGALGLIALVSWTLYLVVHELRLAGVDVGKTGGVLLLGAVAVVAMVLLLGGEN